MGLGGRLASSLAAALLALALPIGGRAGGPLTVQAASGTNVSAQQTLINQDRAQNGLGALSWSDCLAAVAVQNAERIMAQGYLSHTNGANLDLDCGVGATQGGENIAYMSGGINDNEANTLFMNSPPHRANILGPYQYVATAWSVAPNGYAYIAEEFLGATGTLVPAGLHPLPPARILDTRSGTGGVPISRLGPGGSLDFTVAGAGGVPASGVGAVVLNVTVTNTTAPGYLTVYPQGDPRPNSSNLNWVGGQTVANLVQVALRDSGQVTIFNAAGYADVIFDVSGYVPTTATAPAGDGLFNPLVPARILDTRDGTGGYRGQLSARQTIALQVASRGGVPATGAEAVVLNLTATNASGAVSSFLTAFPAGLPVPNASNLNFVAGQTVANRVIVRLGSSGQVDLFNAAGWVDAVVDVGGWYTDGAAASTGSTFTGVTPVRILDTRIGVGGFNSKLPAGGTIAVQVSGWGGVPLMTSTSPVPPTAVVLNVTATNPTTDTFLTVYPDGATRPGTSDLNVVAGQSLPNLVVVRIGTDGMVDVYNPAGTTDVIFDVVGWYG